jgi:hypothetical protein
MKKSCLDELGSRASMNSAVVTTKDRKKEKAE